MDLALSLEDLQALRAHARGKISALRAPAESGPSAPFDPRQSAQLSPAQAQALEALQRAYAAKLSAALQDRLQASVELTFSSLQQLSPAQFLEARQGPAYTACLGSAEAPALLALDAGLALALLDRLLGGSGKEAVAARELTTLENQVLQPVAVLSGAELQAAWQPLLPLALPLGEHSREAALQELAGSADRLLAARFEARFQELRGTLWVALSSAIWTALLQRLAPPEQPPRLRPAQHRERLRERLLEGKFPAEARLPLSGVSLRQLSALRVGDVVTLPVHASGSLEVLVAGRPMFLAAPVACGNARGARVQTLLAASPKTEGEKA